jgi:flagellar motility protein MotE (MotC chaperone)
MKGRGLLMAGTIALSLLGGAIAWTAGTEKEPAAAAPSGFSAKSPGADLYALASAVERRAKELDLADLRIQEERKLLEAMKEALRKDLASLDTKLSALEQRSDERAAERKANRQYISKLYKSMDANEASKRLTLLGEQKAAQLLRELKEKDAAKIMTAMDPAFSVAVTRQMEKPQ